MCLYAIFFYPQGKYRAKFIFVTDQTLCNKRLWLLCKYLHVSSWLGSFVWWRSNWGNDVKVAERKWSVVLSQWDRTTKAPLTLVSCFFSHCRQTTDFSFCYKQAFFILNSLFTHSAFDHPQGYYCRMTLLFTTWNINTDFYLLFDITCLDFLIPPFLFFLD